MPTSNKQKIKKRRCTYNKKAILVISVVILLFSAYLSLALFKIQVLEHKDTARAASEQYYSNQIDVPKRGSIYDRNGVKLAASSIVYRVGITPKHLYSSVNSVSKDRILEFLAETLDVELEQVEKLAGKQDSTYEQLAKNIPEDKGKAIEQFMEENLVGGIRLDKEPNRFYLNGNLASQVIGFATYADHDFEGRLGMELAYDDILSGEVGYNYAARDNYLSHGYLPYSSSQEKLKKDGYDLVSTLDINIQNILQEDLEAALKAYDAVEDGMGIVMNPYNGEIYAMASYPYFSSSDPYAAPSGKNPDEWNGEDDKNLEWLQSNVWANKIISSIYEPGSTMKTLTAAVGLEENVTTENTPYSDDPITVLDAEISCYAGGHGYESLAEGFYRSCNPIFVQVALNLGLDNFYKYIRSFGFYDRTGLGLPGEARSLFHTNPSLLDMANLSFGESSAVTPMHMMKAFAALVNGGKLVTPTVLKEVRSQDGEIIHAISPEITRRVISADTSARVRKLMQGMVDYTTNYTNTWGYEMGGKTSTSTDELTGQVTVSFMAAAPISHPEILVLMILQRPSDNTVGGAEAQIVTQNTTSRILDYLNVDRSYTDVDVYKLGKSIRVPGLIGYKVSEAAKMLTFEQIPVVAADEKTLGDSKIVQQFPLPGTLIYPGSNIFVFGDEVKDLTCLVPDLSQMNYNEIIDACNKVGLTPHFVGPLDGNCVDQRIVGAKDATGKAGEEVPFGSVIEVAMDIVTEN